MTLWWWIDTLVDESKKLVEGCSAFPLLVKIFFSDLLQLFSSNPKIGKMWKTGAYSLALRQPELYLLRWLRHYRRCHSNSSIQKFEKVGCWSLNARVWTLWTLSSGIQTPAFKAAREFIKYLGQNSRSLLNNYAKNRTHPQSLILFGLL